MFAAYNLLLTILSPIWVPWMLIRAAKRSEKPNRLERSGEYDIKYTKGVRRVWVHAVSVGEVIAVRPILKELRLLLPSHEIVLTVTTSSGHRTAREQLVGLFDHLFYFPVDVARFQLAAMSRVRPEVVAIMETELWMNFLWAAKAVGARTMLINGRISDRSFAKSRKLSFFYRSLFKNVDRVLAQSEVDQQRLLDLGAKDVEVLGNCKFDEALESQTVDTAAIRTSLGIPEDHQVIVIGSTRDEDEEALVIAAIKGMGLANLSIVHAPRHLERVPELCKAVEQAFGTVASRSLKESGSYLILDTYGELSQTYAIADVVIVGGGFGNYGGQNVIQPLALGKPVLHGPHMQNFREVTHAALRAGASRCCSNSSELESALQELLESEELRDKMGRAALDLVKANAGASSRYAQAIASEAAKAP